MDSRRKIAFLIRKRPDTIGGVQRHSARLYDGLRDSFDIEKIGWNGPEWGAPFYFPLFYRRSIRNGAEVVHCDDAVTALIGARIRKNSSKKVVATVHGLDVILPIPWYQRKLREALPTLDTIICVSRATAEQVRSRNVPAGKIEIIPNAAEKVNIFNRKNEASFRKFYDRTGIDLRGKIVLFSLGRPLRRKGFDYFVTHVFPHLPENIVYVIAGPGSKTPPWLKMAGPILGQKYHRLLILASGCDTVHDELKRLSSHPRVHYLNGISEELRDALFEVSDLLIMPNRKIDGDMEGFGIVALEAAVRGIPVVATGIEGITDAVIDGHNGYCVDDGDVSAMVEIIKSLVENPKRLSDFGKKAKEFTESRFSSSVVHGRYKQIFEKLAAADPLNK